MGPALLWQSLPARGTWKMCLAPGSWLLRIRTKKTRAVCPPTGVLPERPQGRRVFTSIALQLEPKGAAPSRTDEYFSPQIILFPYLSSRFCLSGICVL